MTNGNSIKDTIPLQIKIQINTIKVLKQIKNYLKREKNANKRQLAEIDEENVAEKFTLFV